jgi:glycosyltransferase involved in cell wall biosynthesis
VARTVQRADGRAPTIAHLTVVHAADDVRILVKECRTLAAAGYRVHLVVPGDGDSELDGVRIHGLGTARGGRLGRMTGTVLAAYRAARRLDADVYHVHDPELIPIGLLLRVRGRNVIYDAHEHLPHQILTKPWIPRALRRPVALLADLGERVAARLLSAVVTAEPPVQSRFEGIAARSANVNNYPLLDELSAPAPADDGAERAVCYVGEIAALRGAGEMVDAIGRTDGRLLLAGRVVPAELTGELAHRSGWARVELLGHVDRPTLAQILARSRAGLVVLPPVPNYVEANPTKMFEYMAAGIPVIASDFPTWARIVDRHECGLCVDPTSPDAIAEAIQWILDHPEEARRMGANGREAVERHYNWEAEQGKLLGLYEQLVGPGSTAVVG